MGDHSTLTYPLDLEDIEDIFGYDEGPKSRSRQNLVVHKVKRFHKDGITYEANQNPELSSFLPGTHAVYVKTWGCTHNTSDGEYMAGQLAQQGYRITESRDEADVWILNSCAVKSPSEDHFRNEVNKGLESGKKVIVSGCVPQGRPNAEYIKGLSVIGVQQIDRVVEVVEETLKGNQVRLFGQKKVKMSETAAEESGGKLSRKAGGAPLAMPKIRRNPLVEILAINTGCLNQCTYCKTKHARGELGSYPMEEIVARAEQSFAEGVVEIWLTSEDTGAYGRDIGVTLPDLLWKLVKVIPDGCRLRVGMTNPPYILDHLDEMAKILNHPRVYKFLHIPVQSGSDAVLAAMKREYNNTDFCRVVNILKQKVAGITIATDIICGFPTETDEDFLETVYLCKKYKFPSLYINQFYPRPGTPAAKMKRVTSAKDVKKRTKVLTDLFHSYEPYKKRLDATYTVLVTDVSHDHNYYVGHNDWYEQVLVPKNDNLMGKLVPVRIVSVSKFSMVGKVISDSLVASPTQVQPFKKGVVTCGKSVPREQKQDFFQRILYTISVMALGLAVIVRAYQILNFPTNPRQAATEVNL